MNTKFTEKHGGGNIILLGGFFSTDREAGQIDGKMDEAKYKTILVQNLLGTAKDLK